MSSDEAVGRVAGASVGRATDEAAVAHRTGGAAAGRRAGPDFDPWSEIADSARRNPPRALYVHVPFCVHRCHYCDFSVTRTPSAPVEDWLGALAAELRGRFARLGLPAPLPLDTIFVGGGTPSLLGGEGMEGLARLLRRWFEWDPDEVEWTAEANPGSFDTETCARWRDVGVTRVSIGVQSFADHVLRWLGRLHDTAGAAAALGRARSAGFRDINLDLMFGLPAEVERDWEEEVRTSVATGATHVSTYGLTAEPRTPLGRRVQLGRVRMPDEERYEAEYLTAAAALRAAGFVHYEVSNFARPGRECRHNWTYWSGGPYLGIGPSAHGHLPPFRLWNVFRWDAYRDAVGGGRCAVEGVERVEGAADRLEHVWLGLRTRRGLRLSGAERRLLGHSLESFRREGWIRDAAEHAPDGSCLTQVPRLAHGSRIEQESRPADGSCVAEDRHLADERIRLTAAGWLRLDELATAIDRQLSPRAGVNTGG